MRLIFDTNVLVSAFLFKNSKPRMAFEVAWRLGDILLSEECFAEIEEVLHRKRFRRYVDQEDIRNFLTALTETSERVDVQTHIAACRDPKDDKFLSLAVSGQGTHILTGDADLLVLHPFRGIQILRPGVFVDAHGSGDQA